MDVSLELMSWRSIKARRLTKRPRRYHRKKMIQDERTIRIELTRCLEWNFGRLKNERASNDIESGVWSTLRSNGYWNTSLRSIFFVNLIPIFFVLFVFHLSVFFLPSSILPFSLLPSFFCLTSWNKCRLNRKLIYEGSVNYETWQMLHYINNRDQNLIFFRTFLFVFVRKKEAESVLHSKTDSNDTWKERTEKEKRWKKEEGEETERDQEEEERERKKRERKKKTQKRKKDKKNTTKKKHNYVTHTLRGRRGPETKFELNFDRDWYTTETRKKSCDDMIRLNHIGSFEDIFLLRVSYPYALRFVVVSTRSSRIRSLRDRQEASPTYSRKVINMSLRGKKKVPFIVLKRIHIRIFFSVMESSSSKRYSIVKFGITKKKSRITRQT